MHTRVWKIYDMHADFLKEKNLQYRKLGIYCLGFESPLELGFFLYSSYACASEACDSLH